MAFRLEDTASNFKAVTTFGKIDYEYLGDSQRVLLSHPADYRPA